MSRQALTRLLAVLALPALAAGLAMLLTLKLGLSGRWQPAAAYAAQLAVGLLLARRFFGFRQVGLPGPRPAAGLALSALLLGLRIAPWLAFIPMVGLRQDPVFLATALLYFLLLNAAAEELLFRGLLYQALLGAGAGVVGAAVGASLVFGAAHLFSSSLLFVPVFVADGLALQALRLRADSLVPPIAVHAALNFTTGALLLAPRLIADPVAVGYVVSVVAVDLAYVLLLRWKPRAEHPRLAEAA
jgi:membrane protease YdiL (CAAX protease family)